MVFFLRCHLQKNHAIYSVNQGKCMVIANQDLTILFVIWKEEKTL